MANAIYPGTFDPVHNGHVDIATRGSILFEKLYVGVYAEPSKNILFSTEERVALFKASIVHLHNVEVVPFKGLAVSFARQVGAKFILRGLRAGFDFDYEFELAQVWRNLDRGIDVVCMMSELQYQFIHSSQIKEVAQLGGDVRNLVPAKVATELTAKLKRKAGN